MPTPTRLAVLVTALLCLPACLDPGRLGRSQPDEVAVEEHQWVESEPLPGAELDALWDRSKEILGSKGFAIDDARTRFADRIIATRWITNLSPQRFEGRRTRSWVRFRPSTAGPWIVGASVQTQRNVDIDAPHDPSIAKWEDVPPDGVGGEVLLYLIDSGFRDPVGDGK